jgi:hypothetical protein
MLASHLDDIYFAITYGMLGVVFLCMGSMRVIQNQMIKKIGPHLPEEHKNLGLYNGGVTRLINFYRSIDCNEIPGIRPRKNLSLKLYWIIIISFFMFNIMFIYGFFYFSLYKR